MSKKKLNEYEECLRAFIHTFHTSQIKDRRDLAAEIAKRDKSYAEGYAYGLNDAIKRLKECARENNIQIDALGFESIDLNQIKKAVEESVSE